jgi:HEAT repeat protein
MILSDDTTLAMLTLAFNVVVAGAPIAAAAAIALRIGRSGRPRARYIVALAAFVLSVAVPLAATFAIPSPESFAIPATVASQPPPSPSTATTASASESPLAVQQRSWTSDRVDDAIDLAAASRLGRAAVLLWLVVAAVLLARECIGHALVARVRRAWVPAPCALRCALAWPANVALFLDERDGPCTVGLVRRAVVLRRGLLDELSPSAFERVARHELDHAVWRDPLANALLRAIRAVFWINPALWLLERVARAEREAAADLQAIESHGPGVERGGVAAEFASVLVAVARASERAGSVASLGAEAIHAATGAMLHERVLRLLEIEAPPSRLRRVVATAVAAAGLAMLGLLPLAPPVHSAPARTGAVERLLASLHDRDWQLDDAVKAALDEIRSSDSLDAVIVVLGDPRPSAREKAAWILGQVGDRRAIEPLVAALRDPYGRVRHTAAWALGIIGDERAIEPLRENLADRDEDARHGAVWALGKLHASSCIDAIAGLARDPSRDVRHGVAWALGQIGDPRATEVLEQLARDGDADVRAAAARSLAELSKP